MTYENTSQLERLPSMSRRQIAELCVRLGSQSLRRTTLGRKLQDRLSALQSVDGSMQVQDVQRQLVKLIVEENGDSYMYSQNVTLNKGVRAQQTTLTGPTGTTTITKSPSQTSILFNTGELHNVAVNFVKEPGSTNLDPFQDITYEQAA